MTEEQGAHTSLFCATSAVVKSKRDAFKGQYVKPDGILSGPYHRDARDETKAKVLWDASVQIADEILARDTASV